MSVYQEIDAAESLTEVHDINMTLVDWFRDIATYDSLTKDCEKICRRQTELMERIRKSKTLQTPSGRKALGTKTTSPPPSAALLTPNCASPKARRPIFSKTGKVFSGLQTELHLLDAKLANSRTLMRRLAARMMTFDPKTPIEATALVRFVTRVLQSDEKFDREYIADVLDTCADAMTRVWRPAKQTVH